MSPPKPAKAGRKSGPGKNKTNDDKSCGGENIEMTVEYPEEVRDHLNQLELRLSAKFEILIEETLSKYKLKLENDIESKVNEEVERRLEIERKERKSLVEGEQKEAEQILSGEWEAYNTKQEQMFKAIELKLENMGTTIGELEQGCNFMTKDINELKDNGENDGVIEQLAMLTHQIEEIITRANNAEDQSRRHNLRFYNIPESDEYESSQECEQIVMRKIKEALPNELKERPIYVERAHRLGKKKDKNDENYKDRTMIARFALYKEKELVLQSVRRRGGKLSGKVGVGEDYCDATYKHRKKIMEYLKVAETKNKDIVGGHIDYKTLVVKYKNDNTEKNFYKRFTLKDISAKPSSWFIPTN